MAQARNRQIAGRKAFGMPGASPVTEEHLSRCRDWDDGEILWHCSCGAAYVTAEHWRSGECPELPTAFALKIVRDVEGDTRHRGDVLTTSQVGACPRAVAFSKMKASPRLIARQVSMLTGTALHELMQREGGAGGQVTERCTCDELGGAERVSLPGGEEHHPRCGHALCTFTADVPWSGETLRMSGRVDAIEPLDADTVWDAEKLALVDYKLRNPNARKFADKTDDWIQGNLNLMLAAMALKNPEHPLHGKQVVALVVYTNYFYEWGVPRVFQTPSPDEMKSMMQRVPHAGPAGYTVRELIDENRKALHKETVAEVLKDVPPLGAEQFGGKKCTSYCEYAPLCGVYVPDEF